MHKNNALFLCVVLIVGISCDRANSFECTRYAGKRVSFSATDAQLINKTLTSIKNKNLKDLRSVSEDKLLLVRRFVSGEAKTRGGNFWLRLSPQQIDKDMQIHVSGQTLTDFASPTIFDSVISDMGISIDRKICEKVHRCDVLPMWDELENLIYGLLRCGKNGKAIFSFSDGILMVDMELISESPIGTGLYFSKRPVGYRLSSLIIFQ
jgi:hypothetical protein